MRLLFIAPDMHRGGAERQWATLIPALARRGAETRLLCLNDEGPLFDEVRAAGVPASCLHLGGRTDAQSLRRALTEAGGHPGAVVTRGVSPQLVGEAIARRAGAAHVLNEHTPLTPEGDLLPLRPHQHGLTRLVASRVDQVIAVSEAQVEPLSRRGYRRERIVVVPNGLFDSDVAVRGRREETRRALGLDERDFAVVCVANLRAEKGVRAFVEAVAAARRQVPGLRGLLAGDGPEREALEALTAGGEDVRLLGSRGDVPDLLAACDAFCLLSQAEALPMSILEAMALGLPVVTTDVGGTAEAVAHAETGIVVPPRDTGAAAAALARLAAQPEWARELGEHGQERWRERFSGEAMVDGYERALAEVATR
jgi:glycosyltransferase involved in cell wall biosynthesis